MNLNQFDRNAFVSAVMNDVPTIDYKQQASQITIASVIKMLPKEVQAVYKLTPNYLERSRPNTPCGLDEPYIPIPRKHGGESDFDCIRNNDPEVWAKLEELAALHKTQEERLSDLEAKLRGVIGSCRTLKQAKERLPEFEKYLPADRASTGVANLPVANLVADLTNAGWPKSKPKARK